MKLRTGVWLGNPKDQIPFADTLIIQLTLEVLLDYKKQWCPWAPRPRTQSLINPLSASLAQIAPAPSVRPCHQRPLCACKLHIPLSKLCRQGGPLNESDIIAVDAKIEPGLKCPTKALYDRDATLQAHHPILTESGLPVPTQLDITASLQGIAHILGPDHLRRAFADATPM